MAEEFHAEPTGCTDALHKDGSGAIEHQSVFSRRRFRRPASDVKGICLYPVKWEATLNWTEMLG